MKEHTSFAARTAVFIGGLFFSTALCTTACLAQSSTATPYMVHEDWEMVINDPDVRTHSPQVTFFTCPDAGNEECYFQLQMNYHAEEDFSGGGFHVGAYHNGQQLDQARSRTRNPLSVDGDHIRWTSIMASMNDKLVYAVNNGRSDDWGRFGGPAYLVHMEHDHHNDLSNYSPQKSIEMVDIGFGGNRVTWIKLRRVRYFYTDGTVKTVPVQSLANAN